MQDCIFCQQIKEEQILYQTEHFKVVLDINPIRAGHLLLISKKHFLSVQELPQSVLLDCIKLEQALCRLLEEKFGLVGTTVVRNNAGVMDKGTHFHGHVIPRYPDDRFWHKLAPEQKDLNLDKLHSILQEEI